MVLKVELASLNLSRFNPYINNYTFSKLVSDFDGSAFKVLTFGNNKSLPFISPVSKKGLSFKNFGVCIKDKFHIPPVLECECGFYSFKSLNLALEYSYYYKNSFVFLVNLFGEIIEHDIGYRSRELDITSVILGDTCYLCGSNVDIAGNFLGSLVKCRSCINLKRSLFPRKYSCFNREFFLENKINVNYYSFL